MRPAVGPRIGDLQAGDFPIPGKSFNDTGAGEAVIHGLSAAIVDPRFRQVSTNLINSAL
jgi:hypothetical protein